MHFDAEQDMRRIMELTCKEIHELYYLFPEKRSISKAYAILYCCVLHSVLLWRYFELSPLLPCNCAHNRVFFYRFRRPRKSSALIIDILIINKDGVDVSFFFLFIVKDVKFINILERERNKWCLVLTS